VNLWICEYFFTLFKGIFILLTELYLRVFKTIFFNIFQYSQTPQKCLIFYPFFLKDDFLNNCDNFNDSLYLWKLQLFPVVFQYSQTLKKCLIFSPFFSPPFSPYSSNFPNFTKLGQLVIICINITGSIHPTKITNNLYYFLNNPSTLEGKTQILTLFFRFCKN
jgi:hypothetical protein